MPLTGLRIGSNGSLQPSVSKMLRPRMEGLAERSLRADVFVDGLFRQTAQVPYGPYSIELQPQFPGRGDRGFRCAVVWPIQRFTVCERWLPLCPFFFRFVVQLESVAGANVLVRIGRCRYLDSARKHLR